MLYPNAGFYVASRSSKNTRLAKNPPTNPHEYLIWCEDNILLSVIS